MDNSFIKQIAEQVGEWRINGYQGAEKETINILNHIKRVGFLYAPQLEALETYIYIKERLGNKSSLEIYKSYYKNDKDLLLGLGICKDEAFDLIGNKKKIDGLLIEQFGSLDYANQVYALTMGAGKTILMAVMMVYDFTLSFYHPADKRFAKNALVFAPDKTIIESLKEIKSFDYGRVLPKEYQNILLNIKYHYLENVDTPLTPIGNYNVIVSNSQKIILKTSHTKNNLGGLFADMKYLAKREIENSRLLTIRQLEGLAIFVDEAHHSYGKNLEGDLKKTRQTIDYLHGNAPLVGVINLTGTPYINNRMIADVVYHYGLKEGIEKGILKQVRFSEYSNVKDESFVKEVVGAFWDEYGEKRLEGKLPKIAFYAGSINDLRTNLKPKLEKIMMAKGIVLDKVLEYHTEAEESREEFIALDMPESKKQFILLVGKGTEGWNCRSLVATALFRKPQSSIFVLQSSTRCLRCIGDSSTLAHIFLSNDNYKVLDKELKNSFNTNIDELGTLGQISIEHTLQVEKRKKIKVNKVYKEIVSAQNNNLDKIKIDFKKFKPDDYQSFISEGSITLEDGKAGYRQARAVKKIEEKNDLVYYEIIEQINRYTHLPCLDIEIVLTSNGLNRQELEKKVNQNISLLPFIIQQILINAYKYEEKIETIEEDLELTKFYPFKINVDKGRNALVVYKERLEQDEGKSRLGFHINPYNFDSADEKDLFKYLLGVLDKDEAIVDVYFTGGATDQTHNDFYFEYYSPDDKRVAKYFPDFLLETTKGRYLVIEVKSSREKANYEANKAKYKGKAGELFSEVLAKEIGFNEFQKANKNFEYRIIFDASLQKRQQELLEEIKKN